MFTQKQLEFLRAALSAKGTAIPCDEGGQSAREYIAVLDEIDAQLRDMVVTAPTLKAVDESAK